MTWRALSGEVYLHTAGHDGEYGRLSGARNTGRLSLGQHLTWAVAGHQAGESLRTSTRLTFRVNAHMDARGKGRNSSSVECWFSMSPLEDRSLRTSSSVECLF